MIGSMTDAQAVRYFQDKLAYESSPRQVVASQKAGEKLIVVDVRREEAFVKGHAPRAIHMTYTQVTDAVARLDHTATIVVYDWGPASTESTRACLSLAAQGFQVREMIGGFEYWSRLGLGIEDAHTVVKHRVADPLVTTSKEGWD